MVDKFEKEPKEFDPIFKRLGHLPSKTQFRLCVKEKRRYNTRSPQITKVNKGLFHTWLRNRNKLGGQNKIPRLSNERSLITELIELNEVLHIGQEQQSKD